MPVNNLIEFSTILIFRDTPETRSAFGSPIDENARKTAVPGTKDSRSPYYMKLIDQSFQYGWRTGYPYIEAALNSGTPPLSGPGSDGSGTNLWVNAVRNNILQSIGADVSVSLGYNIPPSTAGTGIIVDDIFYVGDSEDEDYEYQIDTTFTVPNPALGVGDFLFWGDDSSSLNIGGKIAEVYASGTSEYNMGKRYRFAKNTKDAFPIDIDDNIIPQNIYYYRKNWNGKDVKNNIQVNNTEVGGGFYVLIKIEPDNAGFPLRYPFFGLTGVAGDPVYNYAMTKMVDDSTPEKYIFPELVRIRKISNSFDNQETVDSLYSGEIIPCTMHRTSNFFYNSDNLGTDGKLNSLFGDSNVSYPSICPQWCAYYVNPYGGSGQKLDKNSTYVIEINERLPAIPSGDIPTKESFFGFVYDGGF